jgi:hypothetical protein
MHQPPLQKTRQAARGLPSFLHQGRVNESRSAGYGVNDQSLTSICYPVPGAFWTSSLCHATALEKRSAILLIAYRTASSIYGVGFESVASRSAERSTELVPKPHAKATRNEKPALAEWSGHNTLALALTLALTRAILALAVTPAGLDRYKWCRQAYGGLSLS